MKDFFTALLLALMLVIGSIVVLAMTIGSAKADELPPMPEKVKSDDCHYVRHPSDEARPVCSYEENGVRYTLKGKGYIRFRICGEPYTMDIDCSKEVAQ